jgi:hypothetical protein
VGGAHFRRAFQGFAPKYRSPCREERKVTLKFRGSLQPRSAQIAYWPMCTPPLTSSEFLTAHLLVCLTFIHEFIVAYIPSW